MTSFNDADERHRPRAGLALLPRRGAWLKVQWKDDVVDLSSPSPLNPNVRTIIEQLLVCRDPRSAQPLLQALSQMYDQGVWICLPPVHGGRFFPITDHAALRQWLAAREQPATETIPEALPIQIHGRVVGALRWESPDPDGEGPAMARALGRILQHWRLSSHESRANAEKETIVRLCCAANRHRNLQHVLAEAYDALKGSLPLDSFVATVYDPATAMNVLSYSVAAGKVYVDNLVGPVPNSLQGYIIRHACSLHFDDLYREIERYPDIRILHFGDDPRMRSWVGVPMLLGDERVVGVLSVQHSLPGLYGAQDRRFLEQVAVPVAIAIEKAILLEQRDREIAVLSAQTELSEALVHAHDVRTALDSALIALERSFPGQVYVLYALDAEQRIAAALCKEGGTVYRDESIGAPIATHGLSSYILAQPGPVLFNNEGEIVAAGIVCNEVGDTNFPVTESVIGAALHAVDGSPLGLISVQSYARNAFDQRHAALLASIARQIALVLENARLIEQDQRRLRELEQAQHRVIESERRRAIGDIAAGVAHDFNNLLGAILGNAQLIQLAESLEEAAGMAETIEIAARDAATIVRRIQEFTRSREAADRAPVDVHGLIESAINITRPRWRDEAQLHGSMIEVRSECAPAAPVFGVESELREVLINLIMNAVDAMPEGGALTIGCRQERDRVAIYVRDTGCGMSADVLTRAGQPFFTTKGSQGTGLGLAVSQGIVQRHGGELLLDSVEAQGTTVTMCLPVAQIHQGRHVATREGGARCGRIILVEDDALLRTVLARMLARAGHHVTECASGPEALHHLAQHDADVLLTDLGLPGMSGWELARAARAGRPDLPVILATGWGDRIAPEDARRCGVMLVLPKPLEQKTLLEAVRQALESSTELPRAALAS